LEDVGYRLVGLFFDIISGNGVHRLGTIADARRDVTRYGYLLELATAFTGNGGLIGRLLSGRSIDKRGGYYWHNSCRESSERHGFPWF
jgi:hypothetical protein